MTILHHFEFSTSFDIDLARYEPEVGRLGTSVFGHVFSLPQKGLLITGGGLMLKHKGIPIPSAATPYVQDFNYPIAVHARLHLWGPVNDPVLFPVFGTSLGPQIRMHGENIGSFFQHYLVPNLATQRVLEAPSYPAFWRIEVWGASTPGKDVLDVDGYACINGFNGENTNQFYGRVEAL